MSALALGIRPTLLRDILNSRNITEDQIYRLLLAIYNLPPPPRFDPIPTHTKEGKLMTPHGKYVFYIQQRQKQAERGKISILNSGCRTSAAILHNSRKAGMSNTKRIHEGIIVCSELRLLEYELNDHGVLWYRKLELTDKGIKYLDMYNALLNMLNYFDLKNGLHYSV